MALGVGGWAEVRPGFERIVEGRMGGVHVLRCMHCTLTKNKSQMLALAERVFCVACSLKTKS